LKVDAFNELLELLDLDFVILKRARRSRTRSEEPSWGVGSAVTSAMTTASRATREKSDQRMVGVDKGIIKGYVNAM